MVRVTGLEPAHLTASEPNGSATLLECFSDLRDTAQEQY